MSTDQSHIDSQNISWGGVLKKSHRTLPEQFVGLGIYLILAFGVQLICPLSQNFFGWGYAACLGLSMWTLWRCFSLRVLKVELSLFLTQFLLQSFWFFVSGHELLSLVLLLLLWCNTLLATMLFWKKEMLSGILLLYPILWIFYLVGLNMFVSMSNP